MSEILTTFYQYAWVFIFWLIVICGVLAISLVLLCIGDKLMRQTIKHLKGYAALYDYAWNRNQFKAWLELKKKKTPPGPPDFPMSSDMAKSGLWGHVTRKEATDEPNR